jgi:5-formaminoimidazole-4-carboxamide-1-(beta)-D-ribofuranosyl 5'-monophosphate synthetase
MALDRKTVQKLLDKYPDVPTIGAIASHSALDIFDGAVAEGFRSYAICQRGRENTYAHYFQTTRDAVGNVLKGCVDETHVLDNFSDVVKGDELDRLRNEGVIMIPNRALSSYLSIEEVEEKLMVPIIGSREMLKLEERTEEENFTNILERARLPHPPSVPDPKSIDSLCIVKLPHGQKPLERGFFTCASYDEYQKKSEALVKGGTIQEADLAKARIERYILGPVFNLNYFFSPLSSRFEGLELLGLDERWESSLDGLVRLPADQQLTLGDAEKIPGYRVVGHSSITLRESLLEEVFRMGEKFVDTARDLYSPGIIGPFCLQTVVDKDGKFSIFDVSLRIGGGTNIHMSVGHPYGNTLWRAPMSTGRRLALEIRRALDGGNLDELIT